ncbi:pyocin knob domain-containing protein [Limosilactobacillus sp.]|uniref:pyocin knob domain-containing protein n=1 Tax=Limosilactobacillus sp. TaxID=2773925 RepID=UPI003F0E3CF3
MSLKNEMTGLMSAVRAFSSDSDDAQLSIDDATSVLRAFKMLTGDPFTISVTKKQILDANNLKQSGVFFISVNDQGEDIGSVETTKKYHYPTNGYWWWLINISNNASAVRRSIQIAITDQNPKIYVRAIVNGGAEQWTKLGGVIKPTLSAFKRHFLSLMGGVAYVA